MSLVEAMGLLRDPQLPVRVYGLRSVIAIASHHARTRHLPASAENLKATEEILFDAASSSLRDMDSYLYLSAVEALAHLVDLTPTEFVPRVLCLFKTPCLVFEVRAKVGEVLCRALVRMGEMVGEWQGRARGVAHTKGGRAGRGGVRGRATARGGRW